MENPTRPLLSDFVQDLPQIQRMGLGPDELGAIPVHFEPSDGEEFLSLGELPPSADRSEPGQFGFVGTRQAYVFRSDLPEALWGRLENGLMPRRPSGAARESMFGTPDEHVRDDDDPRQSWRQLDAGAPTFPEER